MKTMRMMTTSSMMMTNNRTNSHATMEWIGYFLMIVSVVGIDQLTKALVFHYLRPIGSYDLWPGVFRLQYCENTGAAFSILEGKTWFFIVLTILLCSFILILLFKRIVRSSYARIALICVVSGGIGNLIDRVFRGFVVDMFDFYLIDFAVFNVADIFVCCGCALFVFLFLATKGDVLDL